MTNNFDIFAGVQQKLKKDASQVAGLVGMSLTKLADELLQPFMTVGARRIGRLYSAIDFLHSRGVEYGESMTNILHNGRIKIDTGDDDIDSLSVLSYLVAFPNYYNWESKVLEGMNEYLNHLETK